MLKWCIRFFFHAFSTNHGVKKRNGLKVLSYDPEDRTFRVETTGKALFAIQEKSRKDAVERALAKLQYNGQ